MREAVGVERILVYGEGRDEALECILKGNGFQIFTAEKESELCRLFGEDGMSLLLLYFGGENIADSLSLLAKLRQAGRRPILVKLPQEEEALRIMALNTGADDVVGRECSVLEGVARIQALLRCYRRLSTCRRQDKLIKMDGLEMDDAAKLVRVEGNRVNLTPTEYKILYLLMEKPGRVLSNRQIYESIWKMAPIGADNTVAVHIRHIREKIEENPQNPRYLRVVWGQGYKVG